MQNILKEMGLSKQQIRLCNKRYKAMKHLFTYEAWCIAYAALNSTKKMPQGDNK